MAASPNALLQPCSNKQHTDSNATTSTAHHHHAPTDTTTGTITTTARRHRKENLRDFISRKREIFLVQMTLENRLAEIRKLVRCVLSSGMDFAHNTTRRRSTPNSEQRPLRAATRACRRTQSALLPFSRKATPRCKRPSNVLRTRAERVRNVWRSSNDSRPLRWPWAATLPRRRSLWRTAAATARFY